MNCTSVKMISIIFSLLLPNNIFAQDSLYQIGTLQGDSIEEPIFNINKAGDINRDGYDDFITCIPKGNYCEIYLGGDSLDLTPDIILKCSPEIYDFGFFIGDIGDVNNDGYDDFIIQGKYDPQYFIGQIHLYLGGMSIDTIPTFTFHDSFIQDALGSSISGGDVNGDGFSDFIIGNPYNWTDGIGRAYLFFGGITISETPNITYINDSLVDSYGAFVSLNGDINGDNFNDIIISAPNISGNPNTNSKLFVHYGAESIENTADTILNYATPFTNINSIYIPDFNGDGYDDFYITTENILFFGSKNSSFDNYLLFSNSEELSSFGATAGSGGDINNDGFDDLIIGATNHKNKNEIMVGGAYVFLGSVQPDTIPDYFIEGETKWSSFGKKVGSLGDINGDGYDEIYVLADGYPDSENPLGKVYIYSMKKFLVSVKEENQTKIPHHFKLFQNYPNPFNPSTKIEFQLPEKSFVNLTIYNSLGEQVEELVNGFMGSGKYSVEFNGADLPSGLYLYKLKAGNFVSVKKMTLIK